MKKREKNDEGFWCDVGVSNTVGKNKWFILTVRLCGWILITVGKR